MQDDGWSQGADNPDQNRASPLLAKREQSDLGSQNNDDDEQLNSTKRSDAPCRSIKLFARCDCSKERGLGRRTPLVEVDGCDGSLPECEGIVMMTTHITRLKAMDGR